MAPPPPLAEEPAQDDHLSALPDHLLSHILSLLPLKLAAATSVLSSRYRHLWTTIHLALDDSALSRAAPSAHWSDDQLWRFRTVARILTSHAGPVRSLRVTSFYYRVSPDSSSALDSWVAAATRRGAEELVVHNNGLAEGEYELNPSVLQCDSLKLLDLATCRFPCASLPSILRLSGLRELRLRRTWVTDEMVGDILAGCPVLEGLKLAGCGGLKCLAVRSGSLRWLEVETWMSPDVREVVVEDAPVMERLVLEHCLTPVTPVRVVSAPKLEMLGFVNADIKHFQFGGNIFEISSVDKISDGMSSPVLHLKKLVIKVNFNQTKQSKMVAALLRCFPCLETLSIWIADMDKASTGYLDFWDQQGSFDFLYQHLKNVTVFGFLGQKTDTAFVRYFITRAQALKTITLHCGRNWSPDWAETKETELGIEDRASLSAQVLIKKVDHYGDEMINLLLSHA